MKKKVNFLGNFLNHDAKREDKQLRILKIRKNATNSTAGFSYGLGCSLVHLCMFITILFIERPHIGKAKELDKKYHQDIKSKFSD